MLSARCSAQKKSRKRPENRPAQTPPIGVSLMAELLHGVRVVKALSWEPAFVSRLGRARRLELRQLAVRKYLDAMCVYFWAATQLLFSVLTFGLMALLGIELRWGAAQPD